MEWLKDSADTEAGAGNDASSYSCRSELRFYLYLILPCCIIGRLGCLLLREIELLQTAYSPKPLNPKPYTAVGFVEGLRVTSGFQRNPKA